MTRKVLIFDSCSLVGVVMRVVASSMGMSSLMVAVCSSVTASSASRVQPAKVADSRQAASSPTM